MVDKKLVFVFCCILLSVFFIYPQQVSLQKLYSTGKTYNIDFPVMTDNVNSKGESFRNKDMLESFISFPERKDFTEQLNSDLSGYFQISKAQRGAGFYLYSFDLTADYFTKTVIKITSPGMFEVYIDGKKEASKVTTEGSFSEAKVMRLSFTTPPGTYNVLLKYMSLPSNKSTEGLKITVEPEDKNTQVKYSFGDMTKRNISVKDMLLGTRISEVSISPNGQYVLIDYSTVDGTGKSVATKELFIRRNNRKITLQGAKNYRWMPYSNKLYFTDSLYGKLNLMSLDPETMEEAALATDIPAGDFIFSPNENFLIYTEIEQLENKNNGFIKLDSPEDRLPGYRNKCYLSKYDLSTGTKQRLTFGKESTILNDISKDSRYLLYSIQEYTPTERPFYTNSMYRLDLLTLQVETLWKRDGFTGSAVFSPDGNSVLAEGSAEAFNGIGNTLKTGKVPNFFNKLAFIMDLSTKNVQVVTKDFNPSVDASFWNPSDGMIYLKVTDKDYQRLYKYDTKQNQFKQLQLNEDVVKSVSFSKNGAQAAYYGSGLSNSTKAYVLDLKSEQSDLISDPFKPNLEKMALGQVKDWSFVSSGGSKIDGLYYLPPNFNPSEKYPLIVYFYGGILPTLRSFEAPVPLQVYAASGYVVYVLQPTGAIGYGQEFASGQVNAWGKPAADEIIEGTKKFISEHSFVNATKVGCLGTSYGGFLSMYLQTQTDIFKAAVSHAGISTISGYWGEGYSGYTYAAGAGANSYPWNNREIYVDQSPLYSADKIKTPLLLLHGTEDTNVPIGESMQMFTALKILGSPVEFIQIKGEGHGIRDIKKRIEWNNTICAWFAKWLQDSPEWWNSLYSAATD